MNIRHNRNISMSKSVRFHIRVCVHVLWCGKPLSHLYYIKIQIILNGICTLYILYINTASIHTHIPDADDIWLETFIIVIGVVFIKSANGRKKM